MSRSIGLGLLPVIGLVFVTGTLAALSSSKNWMAAAIVAWVALGLALLSVFLTNVVITFDDRGKQ